jgi:two-component sensor histidine kinase
LEGAALLQKTSEDIAESLQRAAEAQARADAIDDPKRKADYESIARTWRKLARSYEFQGSLGRFISFNQSRQKAVAPLPATLKKLSSAVDLKRKADLLDKLAGLSERIQPYSVAAFGVAAASVFVATLLRFGGGWASSDLRFAIYLPAILATGLLAGIPAAIGAAVASIIIIFWAFMPPYFAFKWPGEAEQINIVLNATPYFITVFFAYCCRVVLQRMRRSELNNRLLAKELEHRGRNVFSVFESIVQKTLAHDLESARKLSGRLRSIQYANDLLTGETQSATVKELLVKEFEVFGENRLQASGPDFYIAPENTRHLILLLHELATNAAKHGSLSAPDGQVFVDWQWDGKTLALNWKERGGPKVTIPKRQGFGSQLIAICVKALSGGMRPDFMPDGYACSLTLRLGSPLIN